MDRWDIITKVVRAVALTNKWDEVVEIFEELEGGMIQMLSEAQKENDPTILHEAIENCLSVSLIQRLINQIVNKVPNHACNKILRSKNKQGNTPLHVAASRGSPATCHAIIRALRRHPRGGDRDSSSSSSTKSHEGKEKGKGKGKGKDKEDEEGDHGDLALNDVNNEGEIPMFIAASHGHKLTFLLLYSLSHKCVPLKQQIWKAEYKDTILHSTLRNQYFELSLLILKLYPEAPFICLYNEKGDGPLDILASHPSSFKSGTHLSFWQNLCYYCTKVKKPKLDVNHDEIHVMDIESCEDEVLGARKHDQTLHSHPGSIREMKEKHQWCKAISEELIKVTEGSDIYDRVKKFYFLPEMENANKSVLKTMKYRLMDLIVTLVHQIRVETTMALSHIISSEAESTEKNPWPVLTAIKYGLMDLMGILVERIPTSFYLTTSKMKNVVHVAVEHRQTHILEGLIMKHPHWLKLREAVDDDGNNALHLVAKLSTRTPSKIQSPAMHLQWEVKWLQFVEGIMPSYFSTQKNKNHEIPSEVFAKEHESLINKSNQWVKDTCTSYIVASTVIASVTFPAGYQLPGGTDSNTGQATLAGKPHENKLDNYLLTIQLAFYFSITSMAIFLALYSHRKKASDYARKLPLALVFGLTTLLVSLVSTLLSFYTTISLALESPHNPNPHPWYYLLLIIPICICILPQIPFYFSLLIASLKKKPDSKYVGENAPP